jgi:Protein of unknown function (DUF3732)
MKAKIARVILWPKFEGATPTFREVGFDMKGVEVVTGGSQRGKSALIPIIDYCLGSEHCRIPIGRIRDAVAWFGIELLFEGKHRLMLCRRNPEGHGSTDEMRIAEGKILKHNAIPTTPISRREVINLLNSRANLPELGISPDSSTPSFRDMIAFNFQPQHIIANPLTLLYLADFSKAQKVEEIFPLVLGAENLKTVEVRHKLKLKRDELESEELKLSKAFDASRLWLPQLQAHFLQFQQLGYINQELELDDAWTVQSLAEHLKTVPDKVSEALPPLPTGGGRSLAKKITSLRRKAQELDREIENLQRRMERVENFRQLASDYQSALQTQHNRLAPTGWFSQFLRKQGVCPFCEGENQKAKHQLNKLLAVTEEIERSLVNVDRTPTVVSEELLELEREQGAREKELNEVSELLSRLISSNEEAQAQKRTSEARRETAGELRAILQTVERVDDSGKLQRGVNRLKDEMGILEQQIDEKSIRATIAKRLDEISQLIVHYAEIIGVEHADRHPRLDPGRLTVKFSGLNGREDFLWEIGSAANWMGYHIATMLAIHQVIRKLPLPSPVPQFLIFDQPSQPYFPEKGLLKSEDVNRVRNVFEALSAFCEATGSGVQIIVIEHAGEAAWKGIKHVFKKHEWRDEGEALIPQSWLGAWQKA